MINGPCGGGDLLSRAPLLGRRQGCEARGCER